MKNNYSKVFAFFLFMLFGVVSKAQSITEIIFPSNMVSSAAGSRVPFVFRAQLSGLRPSAQYYYGTKAVLSTEPGNSGGGGTTIYLKQGANFAFVPNYNFGNAATRDTFRTNSSGEYTGWFAIEPANVGGPGGNRFVAGNYLRMKIFLNNGMGGTTATTSLITKDSVKVMAMDTTSSGGSGVYSKSLGPDKDLVFLYDNTSGTGRPLCGAIIESDGISYKTAGAGIVPANYPLFYRNNVDSVSGAWGNIIPNNNPAGIQRIERRKFSDGTLAMAHTDADGTWPTGTINTANPRTGNAGIEIDGDEDAPLILLPPTVSFFSTTGGAAESGGTLQVGVKLKFPNSNPTSVDVVFIGGSATLGTDFTYTTQTVTFPANSTATQYVSLSYNDDINIEPNETVILGFANLTNGAQIGLANADTLTIYNDDSPFLNFSASSASVAENAGSVQVQIGIMFAQPTATSVEVNLAGGTAAAGLDFTYSNQTITFPANSTTPIVLNIPIVNDTITESNETFVLTLTNPNNSALIGTGTSTITITDDDIVPNISFIGTNQVITENGGNLLIRVALTNPPPVPTTIDVTVSSGSAVLGTDYTLSSTQLTFVAGTNSMQTFILSPINDNLFEGNEFVILKLTNPSPLGNFINQYDTITIADDDLPHYNIGDINNVDVTGFADSLGLHCQISGIVHGVNFRPTGLLFNLQDATGGIWVSRNNGNLGLTNLRDGDSVVVKGIVSQTAGLIQMTTLDTAYRVTTGKPTFPVTTVSAVSEKNEATLVRLMYCRLQNPAQWPTTVGTAQFNILDSSGRVWGTIAYSATDIDSTPVIPYYFHLTALVSQADNTSPYDSVYRLIPRRLSDFEPVYPILSFDTAASTIGEGAGNDSIAVTIKWPALTPTSVNVSLAGGTAVQNLDFNFITAAVNFPANSTAKIRVAVPILNDTLTETSETIFVNLLGQTNNAVIGAIPLHVITISDNDGISGIGKEYPKLGLVSVFPNPVSGMLNIKSESKMEQVIIYDLLGKKMQVADIQGFDVSLNLDELANGYYLLQLVTENGSIIRRISINK